MKPVGRVCGRTSIASGKTRARPHRRAFLPLIDAADDFAVANADELIEQDGPLLQRVRSRIDTSRQFAATQHFGRFWSEADID